ncbi:DNA polymerase III subunit beta, partial [Candidatus Sumerlaeota bacterium]|nr:DNA polymerase III subunit beta [Candidatus Sumerlaeota bacterium]
KAVFKRTDLAFATNVVHTMVNAQSSLPILANILIKAGDGKACFMASDLESSVRCEIAAEVAQDGAITVPAGPFHEIVRVLPDGDVTIALEKKIVREGDRTREVEHVRIGCPSANYDLAFMPAEDFPAWPEIKAKATLELSQKMLRQVVEQFIFAIPQKDPRRVLLGGYFDVHDRVLKCVATDGKKLAYVRREADKHSGQEKASAIVPHKILSEVLKAVGDEGTARILFAERQAGFELGQIKYVTNVIDGVYPNYDLVIPKTFERTMALPREQLRSLIRQAAIMSDERSNSVIFHFENGELRLTAMTYDIGSYEGALAIEYDLPPFDIVFNHRFMAEILDVMESGVVLLKANKSTAPAVLCGKDFADTLYVLMPIKLADLTEPESEETQSSEEEEEPEEEEEEEE